MGLSYLTVLIHKWYNIRRLNLSSVTAPDHFKELFATGFSYLWNFESGIVPIIIIIIIIIIFIIIHTRYHLIITMFNY